MNAAFAREGGYGVPASVIHADSSNPDHIIVPDAGLLFTADFRRAGPDLILTGHDGRHHIIPGYFATEHRPSLTAPNGASLSPDLIDLLAGSPTPNEYAQAQPTASLDPIGRVEKAVGSVAVMRNGVAVALNVGDAVFKSDVIQTGADSQVGISFPDGTALNLTANTRMALNDYNFDPNAASGNGALISLVEGSFSFVAGKVAHTGDMKIDTPVATMGIRGTTGWVMEQVATVSATAGNVTVSFAIVPDFGTNQVGAYDLIDRNGNVVAVVSAAGFATTLTGQGVNQSPSVSVTQLSPAQAQFEQSVIPAIGAVIEHAIQNNLNNQNNPNNQTTPQSTPGNSGSSTGPQDQPGNNNSAPPLVSNPTTTTTTVSTNTGSQTTTIVLAPPTTPTPQPTPTPTPTPTGPDIWSPPSANPSPGSPPIWNGPQNWSAGAPAPGSNVQDNSSIPATINDAESIQNLTLGVGAIVDVVSNSNPNITSSLTVSSSADDAGTIKADSTTSDPTVTFNLATVTVEATGTIEATGSQGYVYFSGDTVDNAGTIKADNSDGLVFNVVFNASGLIGDVVHNFGTMTATSGGGMLIELTELTNEAGAMIEADSGGIVTLISGAPVADVNLGTIEAGAGGTIAFQDVTIDNAAGGTITSLSGGTIDLIGAIISGGTFTNGGLLDIVGSSTLEGNVTVTGGQITIESGQTLTLDDVTLTNVTITDNGTIQVDAGQTLTWTGSDSINGAGVSGDLVFDNDGHIIYTGDVTHDFTAVTFEGSGTVTRDGGGQSSTAADVTLTNEGNTFDGFGVQGGSTSTLINEAAGTFDADVANKIYTLDFGAITNAGTLEASSGATLEIENSAVANTGTITAAAGSQIELSAETISGGTIDLGQGTEIPPSISEISAPQLGGLSSIAPVMSGNGEFIAFLTSTNLPEDTNNLNIVGVDLYDSANGQLTDISAFVPTADLHPGENFSNIPSISADGQSVVFEGQYQVANFNNGNQPTSGPYSNTETDIFLYNTQSQAVTLVESGFSSDGQPVISGNGQFIAVANTNQNFQDYVVVTNDSGGVLTTITGDPNYNNQNGNSFGDAGAVEDPAISSDGRFVSFWSTASEVTVTQNGATSTFSTGNTAEITAEVYVYDRQNNTLQEVSVNNEGVQGNANSGTVSPNSNGDGSNDWASSLSANGTYVVFQSSATNLVAGSGTGSQNGVPNIFNIGASNVYLYDTQTHTIQLVSAGLSGAAANGASYNPEISADGDYVTFESTASNLVAAGSDGQAQTYLYDTQTGTIQLVSAAADGTSADSESDYIAAVSADGSVVTFSSLADNLVVPVSNYGNANVFVEDLNQTSSAATPAGTIDVSGDSTISDNAIVNGGAVTVESGVMLTLDNVTVNGTAIADNGIIDVTGLSKIDDGATLSGGQITIASGQTLILDDVTISNSTITADGTIQVDSGETLTYAGTDTFNSTGDRVVMNDGTIVHAGTLFNGSPMVTFDGDGTDILDGGNRATTVETTVNDGNTFEGFQQFGNDNNQVTIDNDAGTYDADVSGEAIVFDTGNTVTNAGLLEASNGGTLEIENSTVANTGTIEAGAGALVELSHATVNGGALTDNGTIDVIGSSKIDDNANVTGGVIGIENGQTLKLDDVTVHNSTIEALTVYAFTNVSDPSAVTGDFNFASQDFAINNAGEVVGNYGDVNGNYNGFIYNIGTGTYTTVSDPNAVQGGSLNNGPLGTTVTGINDSGEVVGYYNSGSGNFAFTESGGAYTTLSEGGFALGINDSGEIVGVNYVGSNDAEGFLYSGGVYTNLQDPSASTNFGTYAFAINNSGQVLGDYYDGSDDVHGFIRNSNGSYTNISDPLAAESASGGGVSGTHAEGFNNSGQVVGYYVDAGGGVHGFLYSAGNYTTLNDPSAVNGTVAEGINNAGEVVGYYFDGNGNTQAFTYSNGVYTDVNDPSIDNNNIQDLAINNAGQIVISYSDNNGELQGVLANPATGAATLQVDAGDTLTLDDVTLANVTLNFGSNDTLEVDSGETLTYAVGNSLDGGGALTIDNNGHIIYTATVASTIATKTFDGTGTVTFEGAAVSTSTPTVTTINNGNTFDGYATLGGATGTVSMENLAGTYDADVSGQALAFDTGTAIINDGKFEATNGGTFEIESTVNTDTTVVTNAGGTVDAGAGSEALLANATIDGGTVTIAATGLLLGTSPGTGGDGAAEIENATIDNSGTLETGGTFTLDDDTVNGGNLTGTNHGTFNVDNGSSLTLNGVTVQGNANGTGILDNAGTVTLENTLTIAGGSPFTLELNDAGAVSLNGATVTAAVAGETLENNGNTISGYGQIGDGTDHLTLTNETGSTIDANVSDAILTIDTADDNGNSSTLTNAGTLEATSGGELSVHSIVDNTNGTVVASGGFVDFDLGISGGTATISDGGTLKYGWSSNVDTTFDGAGTLQLDHQDQGDPQAYIGTVSGVGSDDVLDLKGFESPTQADDQFTTSAIYDSGANTTALTITDTTQDEASAPITLSGNDTISNGIGWAVTSDGHGGIDATEGTPPVVSFNPTYLSFDGSSFASGPVATTQLGNSANDGVTLGGWVDWNGQSNIDNSGQVVFYNGSTSDAGFGIFGTVTVGGLDLQILTGGNAVVDTGVTLSAGQWSNVALTHVDGNFTLYVDGVADFTTTGGASGIPGIQPDSMMIGGDTGGEDFTGSIADVSVWNAALTQTQIAAIENASLSGAENGLAAYYPLNDGSGTTAADLVNSAGNLSLSGNSTWNSSDSWPVGAVATTENTALTLNGLGVSDPNADDTITVAFDVAHGGLALDNGAGLSGDSGTGTVASPLTLTGTAAEIDTALASGLTYMPDTDFAGTDNLVVNASDGAVDSGPQTLDLNVAPVAQAPTLTAAISDSLDSTTLNTALWNIDLPTVDNAINAPAVIATADGVELQNHGYLQTVAGFTPTAGAPLDVTFSFTLNSTGGYVAVTDLTNGATNSDFGEPANGIEFMANWLPGNIQIDNVSTGQSSGEISAPNNFFVQGDTYDVSITDNGSSQTLTVIDSTDPAAGSVSTTTNFPDPDAGDLVTFTNRESTSNAGGPYTATISDVSISTVTAYQGVEGGSVTLSGIAASVVDPAETLSLILTGFPTGTTFSEGALADSGPYAGDWVVSDPSEIAALNTTPLTMIPPADFSGTFTLAVEAVATDTATLTTGVATSTNSATEDFAVTIAPTEGPPPVDIWNNNDGSYQWFDKDNWSDNTTSPAVGEQATITSGTNPEITSAVTLDGVSLDNGGIGGATISVVSGAILTLLDDTVIANGALSTDFQSKIDVEVGSSGSGSGATFDAVNVTDHDVIEVGMSTTGALLTLDDNTTIGGGGTLTIGFSAANAAVIDVETGQSGSGATLDGVNVYDYGTLEIGNLGTDPTLTLVDGTTVYSGGGGMTIDAGAALDIEQGASGPNYGATLDGLIVTDQGDIEVAVTPGDATVFTLEDGATIKGGGTGGLTIGSQGTVEVESNLNDLGATFDDVGVDNSGDIAVGTGAVPSTLYLTDGTTVADGNVTIGSAGTVDVEAGGIDSIVIIDGASVSNSGAIDVGETTNVTLYLEDNAAIVGGVLTINSGSGLDVELGNFSDSGGATLDDVAVTNNGVIDVDLADSGAILTLDAGTSIGGGTLAIDELGIVDIESGPNGYAVTFDGVTVDNQNVLQIASGATLAITGATTIGGGTLNLAGALEVIGSTLTVANTVTFNNNGGSVIIADGGTADFQGVANPNVSFVGAGTLEFGQSESYAGTVSGFGTEDVLDLTDLGYAASDRVVWTQDGSGGSLAIDNSDGTQVDSIQLAGTYTSADFAQTKDNGNGTAVTFVEPDFVGQVQYPAIVQGEHLFGVNPQVDSSADFVALAYVDTFDYSTSETSYQATQNLERLDPFFLPSANAPETVESFTLQAPGRYGLIVPNIEFGSLSDVQAEGILVYKGQATDGTGDNAIYQAIGTSSGDGSVAFGAPTEITETDDTIYNVKETFRQTNSIASSYAVAWDEFHSSGGYTLEIQLTNINSDGSFTSTAILPITVAASGLADTELPAWDFKPAAGAYVLALAESNTTTSTPLDLHETHDAIQFTGYTLSGDDTAVVTDSTSFTLQPDLAAYTADSNVSNEIVQPIISSLSPYPGQVAEALQFAQSPDNGNDFFVVWNETITSSGSSIGDQVEFAAIKPGVSSPEFRAEFQIADGNAQNVRIAEFTDPNNIAQDDVVVVYGDDTGTHILEYAVINTGATVNQIADITDPTTQAFDNLTVLGNGLIAITYNDLIDSSTGETSQYDFKLFDLAQQGFVVTPANLSSTENNYIAGTQFGDTVTGVSVSGISNLYYFVGAATTSGSGTTNTFTGGAGGDGWNIAVFSDARSDYTITTETGSGPPVITNIVSNGDDPQHTGSLAVSNVQILAFDPVNDPTPHSSTIDVTGGTYVILGDYNTGSVTIEAGATAELDIAATGATSYTGNVVFEASIGTLAVDQLNEFQGTVSFASGTPSSGDVLDLGGFNAHALDTFETSTSFNGTDTTLMVTDTAPGNGHFESITLAGNDTDDIWTATYDGNGGVNVVDPPATESANASVLSAATADGANGAVTFADVNSGDALSANFSPDGSDYHGSFSLSAVTENNGNASVEFDFSNDQINLAPGETLTQSYNITVADAQNPAASQSQTVSVSIGGPGDDNFVFAPGIGADTITNFNPQQDTIDLDHFANAQSVQELQSLVTTDVHGDAVINLGHNDSITLAGVTTAQLTQAIQSSHVILH